MTVWFVKTYVAVSATCRRRMVVSRGLKVLRPKLRTSVPFSNTRASGSPLLAKPGSLSFAYWPRTSLNNEPLKTCESLNVKVSVFTSELPVCSTEFEALPFSKLTPVNFWRLKRSERWLFVRSSESVLSR